MKVLITGANGFIGKNLCLFLREHKDIEILKYDAKNTLEELKEYLQEADFVVHLAGVNRPKDTKEFITGNLGLTKIIIDLLNQYKKKTPLILSSSIQAELDNDYGKSKKAAEDYILDNYKPGIVFRLHNVFGKYCRPNYNSVVATFCDHIAHGQEITINDPGAEIPLIYIDDICKTFLNLIEGKAKPQKPYNYIDPVYKITVGQLAALIKSFDKSVKTIMVPETGDDFIKKLFSTYLSYCDINDMVVDTEKHIDERGSFTELIHTVKCGQFSVSTTKPGITRGNHYHHTKIEKFVVIQGKAKISFRKVNESKVHDFIVDDSKIQVVTIPVGHTHTITNIGDEEMILLIWCNEIFDKNNPDTYYEEV